MKNTFVSNPAWPVLTSYEGAHLRRVALPLGGIGTGTVSLHGSGALRDWEIGNRPAKGFTPAGANFVNSSIAPFFALWAKPEGGEAVTRCLEGPIPPEDYEGSSGSTVPNHGMPRFTEARFEAAYPLGQLHLHDKHVPLRVSLEAFNPLVPGDADASGWPIASLRWVLTNEGDTPVEAAIAGMIPNYIGTNTWEPYLSNVSNGETGNVNEWRSEGRLNGFVMRSEKLDKQSEHWGTLTLAVIDEDAVAVSYRHDWIHGDWGAGPLDFWDDFSADGRLEDHPPTGLDPQATLAATFTIAPGERRVVQFLIAWHFPNRKTWTPTPQEEAVNVPFGVPATASPIAEDTIGNYYTTQFADSWDAATRFVAEKEDLEKRTLQFVSAFCETDLPHEVREAALYNLSTLRTQTVFRIPSGEMLGWEGCHDHVGSCFGSCTHVWNYETAVGFLFGDLSRSMREVEFLHATQENGMMSFRVALPLERNTPDSKNFVGMAAADGQMGVLMRLYRDWKLCGDDEWLRRLWPGAKRALEYCWLPGGWDADRDGLMEGCQHNTMDVDYFGPNPQMGFWYLGALRAMEEMARHLGEPEFATDCRELFEKGSAWQDANLFNGEYYEQQVRPPAAGAVFAPGTRVSWNEIDLKDPEFQLGAGCLVDQLVGQYMAHVCGLGYLGKPENIRKTLESIRRYNGDNETLRGHFNPMRSYVLGQEEALRMCSYPRGGRPVQPFPYFMEVMTGFEYTAACGMLQEGMVEEGLGAIANIRARYDGLRRSPFDEAECGHHYARAMASWTAILALTGFRYSASTGLMQFAASPGAATWFWSNGTAWGTLRQQPTKSGTDVTLTVLHGELVLRELRIGEAVHSFGEGQNFGAGESVALRLAP